MIRPSCWAVLLASLALPCLAQEKEPKAAPAPVAQGGITWAPDFDEALARAQKEGKPLLFAFVMDDEAGNDETVQKVYTDPELIKLSEKFVCVPCNAGAKAKDGNSAAFAGVTVAQQQANEKKARARYMKSELVVAPQHVFCDPKGNEITRKVYLHTADQLRKTMSLVLAGNTKDQDDETQRVAQDEKARVDKLLKELESSNLEVRDAALRGLSSAEDPRALPAVVQRTRAGNDEATRLTAIECLGRKGNYLAIQPLLGLLGDSKAPIVIKVAHALGVIRLPDAAPDLVTLLKKEKRPRVSITALRAAARCHPESPKVLELTLAAVKGSAAQTQAAAIVALGFLKTQPKVVDALRQCVTDRNHNLRGITVWALGNHDSPGVAELLDKIAKEDKSPEVRAMAEKAARRCRGEMKGDEYEGLYSPFFVDFENY